MLTFEALEAIIVARLGGELDLGGELNDIETRASDMIAAMLAVEAIDADMAAVLNEWNETVSPWAVAGMDDGSDLLPGEDMDGDHASALASAGHGTDEDYGCYDSGGDE